jgi:tRNA/rRNA methyltransferase
VRVFPTTEAAIEDLSLVYATTARRRDLQKPVLGPEEASQRVIAHIETGAQAGILFGRERWGLYNEEVALADAIVTLPVEAAFASLNIAQAVLILAYEWRRQSDFGVLPFAESVSEPATKGQLLKLFEHLEDALDEAGFFTAPDKRPTVVLNLRAMLSRGTLSAQEVRTLHGVISSIERKHERPKMNRPNKGQAGEPAK